MGFVEFKEAEAVMLSVAQINEVFEVLHRLASLQREDPLAAAYTTDPMPAQVSYAVARGWVRAWREKPVKGKSRLLLTPEGREAYDEICQEAARLGSPVDGYHKAALGDDLLLDHQRDAPI